MEGFDSNPSTIMKRIGVMQITDSLEIGGSERMSVNFANHLPRSRFVAHLCSTRREGPLVGQLAPDVKYLYLHRRDRFDPAAFLRLVRYIQEQEICILHPHGPSLFIAALAAFFPPHPAVIWHVHSGNYADLGKAKLPYRLATRWIQGIIAVNNPLAEWAKSSLEFPQERVWYVPNFVCLPESRVNPPKLPGISGSRIICVANLRPVKGLVELVQAMRIVISSAPHAHLLIVGQVTDPVYSAKVKREIRVLGVEQNITFMGPRNDVADLLRQSDIGVLSSTSEGLPLALLEYGAAGLPVVSTRVGQCPEVLENGEAGLLVPPRDPAALAEGILRLLESPALRCEYSSKFLSRVQHQYSIDAAIELTAQIYEHILAMDNRNGKHRQ